MIYQNSAYKQVDRYTLSLPRNQSTTGLHDRLKILGRVSEPIDRAGMYYSPSYNDIAEPEKSHKKLDKSGQFDYIYKDHSIVSRLSDRIVKGDDDPYVAYPDYKTSTDKVNTFFLWSILKDGKDIFPQFAFHREENLRKTLKDSAYEALANKKDSYGGKTNNLKRCRRKKLYGIIIAIILLLIVNAGAAIALKGAFYKAFIRPSKRIVSSNHTFSILNDSFISKTDANATFYNNNLWKK